MRTGFSRITLPVLAVGVFSTILLSACGGGDNDSATPAATTPVVKASCAQLVGMTIAAEKIGLPTTGAVVAAASAVPASGAGSSALGEYCLASGNITPVDSTAPNIKFQVALPTVWNSKLMMLGGGGYDGFIPNVKGNVSIASAATLSPLARGYAVVGSDGGNQSQSPGGSTAFLLNKEAHLNWMGDALKKTRDVSNAILGAFYGTVPTKSYFYGGSNGGREALAVAGRWPAEWDGVISLYPARDITPVVLSLVSVSRALAAPGAYLSYAKRSVLHQAALAACDELDGVADGLISNVQACNASFDPSTAMLNGLPVRCPGGAEGGDSCLSDAQLAALKNINSSLPFNFQLASGVTNHPGYNAYIADGGSANTSAIAPTVALLGLGNAPVAYPATRSMTNGAVLADAAMRYMVAADPSYNYLTLDPSNPGPFVSRFSELSTLDVRDTNLTPFATKGGKVLLMHGTEDLLISPRSTEFYYQRLQATMGIGTVDSFLRFYEAPGYGHVVSQVFNVNWDPVTALEDWIERGVDPAANQIVTDTAGVPGRTRPLCLYPTWPKYKGSGDVNSAASFTCVPH